MRVPRSHSVTGQVEDTELVSATQDGEEIQVKILATVAPGTDVRPVVRLAHFLFLLYQGSDIRLGERLLPAGTCAGPSEVLEQSCLLTLQIGLLLSQGILEVSRPEGGL